MAVLEDDSGAKSGTHDLGTGRPDCLQFHFRRKGYFRDFRRALYQCFGQRERPAQRLDGVTGGCAPS
jgi:hypothetical protein